MAFRRSSASRSLTSGPLVLTSERRYGKLLAFFIALALVATAALFGFRHYGYEFSVGPAQEDEVPEIVVRLEAEREALHERVAALNESLERAQLDLQIAAVTQQELERQIVVLNEELGRVRDEMEFLKSAGDAR